MRRALRAAWWAAPIAVFAAAYWRGLFIWFIQDDFAWLNLNLRLAEGHPLWRLALQPAAQGTIRPLSERLFFIGLYQWFGLDALPYRILIYVTQGVNLVLLGLLVRRLTGSPLAAAAAAAFWTLNVGTAASLAWTSTYNQILCCLCLLGALLLFVRYTESRSRRDWILQWLVFLAGFGVLELNVIYPALAGLYALLFARRYLAGTLPLFAISAGYIALHHWVAPKPASGPYAMHWQLDILVTLKRYIIFSPGGERFQGLLASPWAVRLGAVATAGTLLALATFLSWKLLKRNWSALFFAGWFVISLAPVLPLRDHFSDYYLTVPAIGLAGLGGWAFAEAWHRRGYARMAAVMIGALYLGVSVAVAQATLNWQLERTQQARRLVLGVGRAQRLYPGKVILLDGVSSEMFWGYVKDRPFGLVGAREVYLAPGAAAAIQAHPELAHLDEYELPARAAARLLQAAEAVVYDVSGPRPKNITRLFRARLGAPERLPLSRYIDAGKPWFADQLGPGWQPIERGYRWMGRRAELRLAGPQMAGQHLYLAGFCPLEQVAEGPLRLSLEIEGAAAATVEIGRGDAAFQFRFPLAPELIGQESVAVRLELDRTFSPPGESRQLGLAFGLIAIR